MAEGRAVLTPHRPAPPPCFSGGLLARGPAALPGLGRSSSWGKNASALHLSLICLLLASHLSRGVGETLRVILILSNDVKALRTD